MLVLGLPQVGQFSSTFSVSNLYSYYQLDGIVMPSEDSMTNLSQMENNGKPSLLFQVLTAE